MYLVYHVFFFNDTSTTEIYTLSLHDALPISRRNRHPPARRGRGLRAPAATGSGHVPLGAPARPVQAPRADRKSTRLNSSHANISYAVFCFKKKKTFSLSECSYLLAPLISRLH